MRVTVEQDGGAVPAYRIDPAHPAIAAATEALRAVYPDQQVLQAVIAGTLPATTLFEQVIGAKTLFFSFSTADEKLHAPNEFLRLRRIHEGMRAWDALLTSMADGPHRLQPVTPARAAPERRRPSREPATTPPSATSTTEPAAFARFPLAPESGRVPGYDGGFDPATVERAEALLTQSIVVSLHDHPVRFPADMALTPPYNRTGRQHTAFAGLAASGLTAVFDNMMDGTAYVTGNTPWQWDDVVTDLGMRQADIAHQDQVSSCATLRDIEFAHATGRVGIVFGLEAATPIGNDLDKLDILFGLGVRQIGIAYSDSNGLGAGLNEPADYGLTAFGRRAVQRMNDLGLAIDVSHASDRTGIETAAASRAPVFMTHAGARALWDIPRLKGDDALRAVADPAASSASRPRRTPPARPSTRGTRSPRSWTTSATAPTWSGSTTSASVPTRSTATTSACTARSPGCSATRPRPAPSTR